MKDEKELLRIVLNSFPDGNYVKDYERFIEYVVACKDASKSTDFEAMRNHGVDEETIRDLELANDWIRQTVAWCDKYRDARHPTVPDEEL